MEHCHLLLMLGTDFPYRQFYPTSAKVIQVDLRAEQIVRRKWDGSNCASARSACNRLTTLV
jgi:thiamine pyrophosphate-dependent acetolactate synthase large subunit-like protein